MHKTHKDLMRKQCHNLTYIIDIFDVMVAIERNKFYGYSAIWRGFLFSWSGFKNIFFSMESTIKKVISRDCLFLYALFKFTLRKWFSKVAHCGQSCVFGDMAKKRLVFIKLFLLWFTWTEGCFMTMIKGYADVISKLS
jgi:hypothetical protein